MPEHNWSQRLSPSIFTHKTKDQDIERYHLLRRNLVLLMTAVTIIPLTLMALINYHQYQSGLKEEIVSPMQVLASKTKHTFELFLGEKLSNVRFIASAYSIDVLKTRDGLNYIFRALKNEFRGFVDLGLIDCKGIQVNYAGPYDLIKKNYSEQSWYHEVKIRGIYISDVFMGYRKFPHIAIAVHITEGDCDGWVLRATIDTVIFDNLIASMLLDPSSDAFLINDNGELQTNSKFYGEVLSKCPFNPPPGNYGSYVTEEKDPEGLSVISVYTHFDKLRYSLVFINPKSVILKKWFVLKSEMFFVYIFSTLFIIIVIFKSTGILVKKTRESDERREMAYRELEHSQKLSSIGRLAAGVAHEINNPLAIINEKAGLMKDLIERHENFPLNERFIKLTISIQSSVERCKNITQRLLGFARRMEIQFEVLDVNDVLKEVLTFLEKEYIYRNIEVVLQLAEELPKISSDMGQLQQVFLNIISNAIAAIDNNGAISITTWEKDAETIAISIQDNGTGMSEETLKHIFEPFFTTKKGYGTGLGLAITYGIVKKLGGDIKVESKENIGTTFYLYLLKQPKQ
ncbi:MAG: GHKL domain-containing protein [Desulfobacteraceae bacterium]|nr:GHKL domain-containing protein [Desulfobacteraceae bacterium]